jgi:phosphoketolase
VQNSFTSYDLAGAASRHAARGRQIRTLGSNRPGERDLLILARGAEQWIEVEAATNGDTLDAHLCDQAMTGTALPLSALHYALRNKRV